VPVLEIWYLKIYYLLQVPGVADPFPPFLGAAPFFVPFLGVFFPLAIVITPFLSLNL
jgi:hypothetical protein